MNKIIIDMPFISSVALNLFLLAAIALLAWYCMKLLKKIYFITDTIGVVNERTIEFANHLEQVHSMDTYYGDQTIQALIQHSKELKSFIEDYKLEVMPDDYDLQIDFPEDKEDTNEEATE
tara:strand:+ start:904 stop:1263 length:360 start_codon:yes stop_codon:yes gene_type:complete